MTSLRRLTIVLAVFAAAGVATWAHTFYFAPATHMKTENKAVSLSIGTTTVLAEVADTPALREKGLSGRASLEEGRGMWFVFEEDGVWPFWMKDTLMTLDIIWVSATGTVVYIAHGVRPESYPEAFAPAGPARYVLEVPGGFAQKFGIIEGVQVISK